MFGIGGCEEVWSSIFNSIFNSADSEQATLLVSLDLSASFGTIDHNFY